MVLGNKTETSVSSPVLSIHIQTQSMIDDSVINYYEDRGHLTEKSTIDYITVGLT